MYATRVPRAVNRTHCRRGHALAGANLYVTPQGWLRCRTCQRDSTAASDCRRRGGPAEPRVNQDMLITFIQPYVDYFGPVGFARRARVGERSLYRVMNHECRCGLYLADRLLTNGMGRPDLVRLVCPDVPT